MAYQTSCASYTSGRVGLSSATAVVADAAGREQAQHGSPLFPIACYAEDLSCFSVAWHWHEEFEFILAALGPIHVDVNKTRLTLQTGQGVFINSGALHAVEPAEGRALLHSGVFQPRLVGGMDTLRCRSHMAGVVWDRFGQDVILVPEDEDHFTVTLPLVLSPQFFGWLFGLEDNVELIAPQKAAEEYRRKLKAVLEQYG